MTTAAGNGAASSLFLYDFWYLAFASEKVKPGGMLGKTILDEPILFLRTPEGTLTAVRDLCPHRGMPLHHGHFDGKCVECCYHGWMFHPDGRCAKVPSLPEDKSADATRIRLRSYPVRELQGNAWVFIPSRHRRPEDPLPEPPTMPGVGDKAPQIMCSLVYPLDADHAAYTLMDPAHTAYVHTWWWWKQNRVELKEKTKEFEPSELGWKMKRHTAPASNRVYKLMGNQVTTEISYRLPGMRIEAIQGDKHNAVSLLITTPLTAKETEVHQCLYWTLDWLSPLRPVFRYLVHGFLDQDRAAAVLQGEGLAFDPSFMLLGDADAQARWFFALKKEWQQATEERREFRNPVEAATLRWRT